MVETISETLTKIGKKRSKEARIEELRKHKDNKTLKTVLKAMYDPNLESNLPEGAPPYTPADNLEVEGMLHRMSRQLPRFFKGTGHDTMKQIDRERIFINILEQVDPKDAELLIAMKDKTGIKGLTPEIINEAIPNLISEKQS